MDKTTVLLLENAKLKWLVDQLVLENTVLKATIQDLGTVIEKLKEENLNGNVS